MQRSVAFGVTLLSLLLAGCATGPNAELEEGFEMVAAEDYGAARDHYERILAEHPNNPYAHLNLGVAYQQLGQHQLARQHYEAAIANGGGATVTRVAEQAGVDSRTSTVVELARRNLEQMDANPPSLNIELEEGWKLMVDEKYGAARDHYESMLGAFPNNPYVHLNLGVAYQRLGRNDLARLHHEAAVAYGADAVAVRGSEAARDEPREGLRWWREDDRPAERSGDGPRATTVAELARRNLEIMAN